MAKETTDYNWLRRHSLYDQHTQGHPINTLMQGHTPRPDGKLRSANTAVTFKPHQTMAVLRQIKFAPIRETER